MTRQDLYLFIKKQYPSAYAIEFADAAFLLNPSLIAKFIVGASRYAVEIEGKELRVYQCLKTIIKD